MLIQEYLAGLSDNIQAHAVMKKIFQYLGILVCLSLHAAVWGDMADNGVECSAVMEKTSFDAREAFPDFKLVFTNKGEKTVRLLDNIYPVVGLRKPRKAEAPEIRIEIWGKGTGKRFGKVILGKKMPLAWYETGPMKAWREDMMRFITLKPGEKHEVPIKNAYLLLTYFEYLRNNNRYELEVRFKDGYSEPGIRREYVGRQEFNTSSRSPEGAPRW